MFKRKNTRVSRPCPQPVSSREKFRHPLLGEITLNRSPRARRLSISVRPDGEVRLTIPCGDNERTALNFLDQKSAWIEQARVRMLATRNRSSTLPTRPAAIRCGSIRAPAARSAPASAKGLSKFGIRWSSVTKPPKYRMRSARGSNRRGAQRHRPICRSGRPVLPGNSASGAVR